jgi:hypothetical protein
MTALTTTIEQTSLVELFDGIVAASVRSEPVKQAVTAGDESYARRLAPQCAAAGSPPVHGYDGGRRQGQGRRLEMDDAVHVATMSVLTGSRWAPGARVPQRARSSAGR